MPSSINLVLASIKLAEFFKREVDRTLDDMTLPVPCCIDIRMTHVVGAHSGHGPRAVVSAELQVKPMDAPVEPGTYRVLVKR